ncbi:hypothetical protein [Hartmannibacter diazotrophicus]|uniref:hypothetical protein n=1 Tax=Hartmannibacter diazotrophicus TaxID=1482074 RepID=UPI0012FD7E27|nr:hypothetical protein [Hartmannibacter diazotrophicus]
MKSDIRLGQIYSILVIAAFINAVTFVVIEEVQKTDALTALMSGGTLNPIILFSFAWAAWSLWEAEIEPLANSRLENLFIVAMIALIYIPMYWFSWVALTLVGLRVALSSFQLGILAAYLAVPLFWGKLIITFIGLKLLWLDALIVSLAAGYSVKGNMIVPNDQNDPIVVLWSCSSLHGLNYLVLAWLTFSMVNKTKARDNWHILAIGLLGMFLINWIRLFMMARYSHYYDYLHTGTGSQIIAMITLVWIVGISMFGSQRKVAA